MKPLAIALGIVAAIVVLGSEEQPEIRDPCAFMTTTQGYPGCPEFPLWVAQIQDYTDLSCIAEILWSSDLVTLRCADGFRLAVLRVESSRLAPACCDDRPAPSRGRTSPTPPIHLPEEPLSRPELAPADTISNRGVLHPGTW